MQEKNMEFFNNIRETIKAGEIKKPTVKVEVDRLMYIPGETKEFKLERLVEETYKEQVEVSKINTVSGNVYEGQTSFTNDDILFPIKNQTLTDALTSGRLTSPFGWRADPLTGKKKHHNGVDFGYDKGTEVVSAWDGTVIFADSTSGGYGLLVRVIHDFPGSQLVNPLVTEYGHLSVISVNEGDAVKKGDKLGEVGNTGKSTGNHLHFNIMENADGISKLETYYATGNDIKAASSGNIITNNSASSYFSKGTYVDPMPYLQKVKQVSRGYINTGSSSSSPTQYNSSGNNRVFVTNVVDKQLKQGWVNYLYDNTKSPFGFNLQNNNSKIDIIINKSESSIIFEPSNKNPIYQKEIDIKDYSFSGLNEIIYKSINSDLYKQRVNYYKHLILNESGNTITVISPYNGTASTANSDYSVNSTLPPSSANMSFDVDLGDDNAGMVTVLAGCMVTDSLPQTDNFDNELRIYADGDLYGRYLMSYGSCNSFMAFTAGIPIASKTIKIEFLFGGQNSVRWDIKNIVVDALKPSGMYAYDEEQVSMQEVTKNRYVIEKKPSKDPFILGSFKYLDTMSLDNIVSVNIDSQYELYSNQATVTLSNPDGYYSPYFNSYWFPELGISSPFSYDFNGAQISVLSENTPIRIYMGYGEDLVRVFTGFIDKVDVQSEGLISFTCRDTCKILIEKVLINDKKYPDESQDKYKYDGGKLPYWTKSAIVQDLIAETNLLSWRDNSNDRDYPDAVIEETYFKQDIKSQKTGKYVYVKAVPGKEGEFALKDFSDSPKVDAEKSLNPYVEEKGKKFVAYSVKIIDAISEVIKDTGMRIFADRYGTIRLEKIDLKKPITYVYTESENLISLNQTIDFSRGRSHIVVKDKKGNLDHFKDDEIYSELKGELRTLFIYAEWATTYELRELVAKYAFFDMKRLCRTIQVNVPLNPLLDPLDRIWVVNSRTSTRSVYIIKGIKTTFSSDGATQTLDLMWSADAGGGLYSE